MLGSERVLSERLLLAANIALSTCVSAVDSQLMLGINDWMETACRLHNHWRVGASGEAAAHVPPCALQLRSRPPCAETLTAALGRATICAAVQARLPDQFMNSMQVSRASHLR